MKLLLLLVRAGGGVRVWGRRSVGMMRRTHFVAAVLLAAQPSIVSAASGCNASLPFCDPRVGTEMRIQDLLSRATTAEKAGMLFGQGIDRLGVPKLQTGEALHGVVDGCKKDSLGRQFCPSSFPCALNLGASLNESLWKLIGETIATESRALQPGGGARFTPDINLFRDPRWGRGQEVKTTFQPTACTRTPLLE